MANRIYLDLLNYTKSSPSCCEALFDKDHPIFVSQAGTCYSTKRDARIVETSPLASSKISFFPWMKQSIKQVLQFSGASSSDQRNFKWTISDKDIPAYNLFIKPQKLGIGNLKTVGLSVERTLKSNLRATCIEENKEFEDTYNWPYTFQNCRASQTHYMFPNCTFINMAGIRSPDPNRRHCMPMDTLFSPVTIIDAGDFDTSVASANCLTECNIKEYKTAISTGTLDYSSMNEFILAILNDGKFDLTDPFFAGIIQEYYASIA